MKPCIPAARQARMISRVAEEVTTATRTEGCSLLIWRRLFGPSRPGRSRSTVTSEIRKLDRSTSSRCFLDRTSRTDLKPSFRFRSDESPARQNSWRSEEHTYELQSLMRISYDVFCLKKKNT